MLARLPHSDRLTLSQGNVYILPSRAGWAMLLTLVVLLIAAINYQISLGYLLTFLLAGSAAASMVVGHGNLRGLQISLTGAGAMAAPGSHPDAQGLSSATSGGCFAHAPCSVQIKLHNSRRSRRWGIGLALKDAAAPHNPPPQNLSPKDARRAAPQPDPWTWVDVPEQGDASVQLRFVPVQRGLHRLPAITLLTRYPLGAFRVWALWRPAQQVWVYPAPEADAPPLPAASAESGGRSSAQVRSGEEFDGVRAYQSGDPLKLVVWKKAAQSFATGSHQLVSRDRPTAHHHRLWLDARHTGLADPEARLSRLAAWVLMAQQQGHHWGLRLPGGQEIAPDHGAQHAARCLQALAACP